MLQKAEKVKEGDATIYHMAFKPGQKNILITP
jgi:hypothetical protein